jgi:hypothetical protein
MSDIPPKIDDDPDQLGGSDADTLYALQIGPSDNRQEYEDRIEALQGIINNHEVAGQQTDRLIARQREQIAELRAAVRGLLRNPDDPDAKLTGQHALAHSIG